MPGARAERLIKMENQMRNQSEPRSLAAVKTPRLRSRVRALALDGIDHIVEVAFGANSEANIELLKPGGSIASYVTDSPSPKIPCWQMVFKNIRAYFLGSDDFPNEAKSQAARDLNAALE